MIPALLASPAVGGAALNIGKHLLWTLIISKLAGLGGKALTTAASKGLPTLAAKGVAPALTGSAAQTGLRWLGKGAMLVGGAAPYVSSVGAHIARGAGQVGDSLLTAAGGAGGALANAAGTSAGAVARAAGGIPGAFDMASQRQVDKYGKTPLGVVGDIANLLGGAAGTAAEAGGVGAGQALAALGKGAGGAALGVGNMAGGMLGNFTKMLEMANIRDQMATDYELYKGISPSEARAMEQAALTRRRLLSGGTTP